MVSMLFVTVTMLCLCWWQIGDASLCCHEAGEALGLHCQCRQSCAGNDCNSAGNFGIDAQCGTAVCCCGDQCDKASLPELDNCPTNAPTIDPSRHPTNSPSSPPTRNPSVSPTNSPSENPSKSPSAVPTIAPSTSPTMVPSSSPTVTQCADWSPDVDAHGTDEANRNTTLPVPDLSTFPRLCQLGRSGEWSSLDRWYTFDCSCFDPLTGHKLERFMRSLFYEFELNYHGDDGRFESYFQNYATDDIHFGTSLSAQSGITQGAHWYDLESFTSCSAEQPGFPESSRRIAQIMDFSISPGGVYLRDCVQDGNVAYGQVKIVNYRIRDGATENQVGRADFILQREPGSNVWLFQQILINGLTVGYLPQSSP